MTNTVVPRRNPSRQCKRLSDRHTPRSSKRLRLAMLKSYFDPLPEETVENVLRFMSEKPCSSNWTSFVSPTTVLTLAKCDGVLGRCARRLFSSLQLSDQKPEARHEVRQGVLVLGTGCASRNLFPRLSTVLGSDLVDISICRPTFPAIWKRALVNRCLNLKRMTLVMRNASTRYPLDELLAVRSGRLEALSLSWPALSALDVFAIAAHMRGLKFLSLTFRFIEADMTPIWVTTGASLEELRLCEDHGKENNQLEQVQFKGISFISAYCKKIRKLAFEQFPRPLRHAVMDLCNSYGERLEFLTIENSRISSKHLARIAETCPNVRFSVFESGGCSTSGLIAMGAKAAHVNIGRHTVGNKHTSTVESFRRVSEMCENLEGLSLRAQTVPEKVFRALFTFPKRQLVHFKAEYVQEKYIGDVLAVLAEKATTLEKFELTGSLPPVDSLQAIVAACPSLTEVRFTEVYTSDLCPCIYDHYRQFYDPRFEMRAFDVNLNWGTVVAIFLKCRNLRELCFGCPYSAKRSETSSIAEFATACYPARRRNVSISICGSHYA